MFLTTQDGWVHAIDARTGAKIWETRIGTEPIAAQAAPAGIFTAFGGAWDYVLVGTRETANNRFYALDPTTGAVIDYYPKAGDPHSGLGQINGMASVDYARRKVYFGTLGGAASYSLWCLNLGPPSDALQFAWATARVNIGEIEGSPIIRGNRAYVGNNAGVLWAVDADTGSHLYSKTYTGPNDAAVKGFPFPDRRNGDVYYTTTIDAQFGRIVAVTDTGSAFADKWQVIVRKPSVPLLSTLNDRLYVGTEQALSGGGVFQLTLPTGSIVNPVDLDPGLLVIGAPSLDLGQTPYMLHVGSVNGVLHAVQIPF
jgi:outer membrane protein assembly factor BamB